MRPVHLESLLARKRHLRRWIAAIVVAVAAAIAHPSNAERVSPLRLLEVSDLGNPAISPDGLRAAFRVEQASVERNTYDSIWYVESVDGRSAPLRVADGGVPLREAVTGLVLPSPALWSPDGHWIYYRAFLDGRVSVWRAATDGAGAEVVTSDPVDVRDFRLSGDGRTLTYSIGPSPAEVRALEQSEYDDGVHVDDTIIISDNLFQSSLVEGRPTTERFLGDWFSTGPLLAKTRDRWKAIDLATMATRTLSAAEAPAPALTPADLPPGSREASIVAPRPDGRLALLIPVKTADPKFLQKPGANLAVLDNRQSGHLVRCTAELCTNQAITGIQWRPGSDELLFTAVNNANARSQSIYGWNVATGNVRPIVLSNGLVSGSQRYWDIPCAVSTETMVCVAAEADHPPRLEAIDLSAGRRRILFEPNKKLEADIAATVPARLIRWKDKRGREFTGQLFEARRTNPDKPPPLFVTFYDCDGFLRGGLGDEWPLASLAEDGITALCINALPGFPKDFIARHDQGRAAIESVVANLSGEGRIDRARVGMGGLSYGSEVTMWTVAHSDIITAASVSGISSSQTYYLFNSLRPAFRSNLKNLWQLGSPQETPDRWREISPAFQLDRIHTPILFQEAEKEYRMALDYALPLVRRGLGDIYVFPQEAHIKFQPRHKLAVYRRNLDWFRFWLQGYEDADPAKAAQYRHWEEMRAARDSADRNRHPVQHNGS
jgi:dipeptidyl aminopeptidase/acylaminoacyl peptidase